MIYKSADANKSGFINKDQLKEAILSNMDKVEMIAESSTLPDSNPIVQQIMLTLDDSGSGTIQRLELEQALEEAAESNNIELDVKQIVGSMFNRRSGLNRHIIRQQLNQTFESFDVSEPIQD